jgi:hypothetical protein
LQSAAAARSLACGTWSIRFAGRSTCGERSYARPQGPSGTTLGRLIGTTAAEQKLLVCMYIVIFVKVILLTQLHIHSYLSKLEIFDSIFFRKSLPSAKSKTVVHCENIFLKLIQTMSFTYTIA